MKIVILKTSDDKTMKKLFDELDKHDDKEIDCFIQNSQLEKYRNEYPYVNFIGIGQERFENLMEEVTDKMCKKKYDQLYITLSGISGYNFWNVVSVAKMIRFKEAFFYNCNGERMQIPKKSVVKDTLGKLYIQYINYIYS